MHVTSAGKVIYLTGRTDLAVKTTRRNPIVITCILSGVLGMLVSFGGNAANSAYAADSTPKASIADLMSIQNALTSIADQLKPSVVFITAEHTVKDTGGMDPEDFFRGFPFGPTGPSPKGGQRPKAISSGSGVIIRSDGYILTNDHVVADAERVTVKLNDGRKFTGKVFADPSSDLAVVKIDATGLPAAKLADSGKVKVGQWAIAIGSPFGLTNSVTIGFISAVTRDAAVPDPESPNGARYYPDLIQTDASINPGNSGGPLVNIDGEVIGINSVIESPSGANAGIGFAVPSNSAKFAMDQLIATGKVVRGFLGLEPRDISPDAAKTLGVAKGALVNSVDEDTPAGQAGIRPMDVIVEINGKPIVDALTLRRTVTEIKPGTKIPIVLLRDGKKESLQLIVGEKLAKVAQAPEATKSKLGLSVQDLSPDLAEKLGLNPDVKGVVVKSVDDDGAAGRANPPITPGVLITKINSQTIKSVSDYNKAVSELKSGDAALVIIRLKNRTTISEVTID